MSVVSLSDYDREHAGHSGTLAEEKLLLYSLVRLLEPERVLETGVSVGNSTCWLAQALKDNNKGKLTSVDDWRGTHGAQASSPDKALARLKDNGLEEFVEMIKSDSLKYMKAQKDDSFDMVWLDDNHDYSHVIQEIKEALRIVKKIIIVHDTNQKNFTGPKEACIEIGGGFWIRGKKGLWLKNAAKCSSAGKQTVPSEGTVSPTPEKKATKT